MTTFKKHKYKNEDMKVPIYSWVPQNEYEAELEKQNNLVEQAERLAKLPFIYKHVALMPDGHSGYGMPIGGVIAAKDVIIPTAVGGDIGCGMAFVKTDLHKSDVSDKQLNKFTKNIKNKIPLGPARYKKQFKSYTRIETSNKIYKGKISFSDNEYNDELGKKLEKLDKWLCSLGDGNHFIEIQYDKKGYICIMVHSGSRKFGAEVYETFNDIAEELNSKWHSSVTRKLPFLPVYSDEGQDYINWMNIALDFAKENRAKMIDIIKEELRGIDNNIEFNTKIDCHHNYAQIENHYGKNVWIHRKGAILARKGTKGIIPGAMGTKSYIVEGLQNEESFHSCSHGAGRIMSRNKAKNNFTHEETLRELQNKNIKIGRPSKSEYEDLPWVDNTVADENKKAYKNINTIINRELDLIEPINILKPLIVIKG
jgi:tRNA-splicing ligase RtcB